MSCVMMDLDDFKSINDFHGHPVGDAALVHFSQVLHQHVRTTDVLARLGGDEFALLLLRARDVDARSVVDRLQAEVTASPLPIHGKLISLRFSAGVAERQVDEPLSEALARADAALLESKRCNKILTSPLKNESLAKEFNSGILHA